MACLCSTRLNVLFIQRTMNLQKSVPEKVLKCLELKFTRKRLDIEHSQNCFPNLTLRSEQDHNREIVWKRDFLSFC